MMPLRKMLLLSFLAIPTLAIYSPSVGRKPLVAPEIVQFDPSEDYSPAYLAALDILEAEARTRGLDGITGRIGTLRATLVRENLLETVSEIMDYVRDQGLGPDGDDPLWISAQQVAGFLREWSYLKATSHPLEVTVDRERRVYRLAWNKGGCDGWCQGQFDGVEIPFPPIMELEVSVFFDPVTGGRYGYHVKNRPGSSAAIRSTMWLESRFFTEEHLKAVGRLSFPQQKVQLPVGWVWVMYPKWGGHFQLAVFDGKDLLTHIRPGSAFEIPAVLTLPFETLPSVLDVWVEIDGYQATRDIHEQPENALRAFSEFQKVEVAPDRTVRIPRFAYHGKTIGPVPAPPEGTTREQFIGGVSADLEDARQWGWLEDGEAAWFRDRLEELKTSGDGGAIDRVLERVVSGSRDGKLLKEAEVLLKVNMEYLRKRFAPRLKPSARW